MQPRDKTFKHFIFKVFSREVADKDFGVQVVEKWFHSIIKVINVHIFLISFISFNWKILTLPNSTKLSKKSGIIFRIKHNIHNIIVDYIVNKYWRRWYWYGHGTPIAYRCCRRQLYLEAMCVSSLIGSKCSWQSHFIANIHSATTPTSFYLSKFAWTNV